MPFARTLRWIGLTAGAAALAVTVARWHFALPVRADVSPGAAHDAADTGALAERLLPLAQEHDGLSGLHPLHSGEAAFAARVLLADQAAVSIDALYYIWHRDLTGLLLLSAPRRAAARGVQVRLLLDDNGIEGLDPILAELDDDPNFEVRLYNPFPIRTVKWAGYLFDFFRLNHRMHNKSLTIDGVATVVGGRNVGDEYFGTGEQPAYVDLDVLAAGAVVADVSTDFARYWNSASAYPLSNIITAPAAQGGLQQAVTAAKASPQMDDYTRQLKDDDTIARLVAGDLPLEWTTTQLVSDAPVKTLGLARRDQLLVGRLGPLFGDVHQSLDVISPYFVPGERGVAEFLKLSARGVRVRILTNALEATDVLPVHAGYAKYRHRLLEGGVELFELKREGAPSERRRDAGPLGSSGSSLHAKTFAADGERIYIGSFNFDPRSVQLNTEMGVLIDSSTMANNMAGYFDDRLLSLAYRLNLDEGGSIQWIEQGVDGKRVYSHDPNASLATRTAVTAIGLLPIQWLL